MKNISINQYVIRLFLLLVGSLTGIQAFACEAHQVKRIISSDPGATEIIAALGDADLLVGIDSSSIQPDPELPLPVVGYQRQLPAEGLLSLQPDLVIGGEHMGPGKTINLLKKANIEVLSIPSAIDSPSLQAKVQTIAKSIGSEAQAAEINRSIEAQMLRIKNNRQLANQRMIFLLQTSDSQKVLRVGGKGSVGDSLINLFGAENSVAFNNYQTLSEESLLSLESDIIILGTPGPHNENTIDDFLNQFPLLNALKGKLVILPFDTASLVAGLSLSALDEAESLSASFSSNIIAKE